MRISKQQKISPLGTNIARRKLEKLYKCNICKKKVKTRKSLQRHLRGHKPEFVCDLCSQAFPYKFVLIQHIQSIHRENWKFSCDICQFKTGTRFNFRKHVKMFHWKVKNYSCKSCYKIFNSSFDLKRHSQAMHLEKNVYFCCNCKFKTKYQQSLERHLENFCINKTDKTPKVPCLICGKLLSKSSLKYHIENVHEKTNQCKICDAVLHNHEIRK